MAWTRRAAPAIVRPLPRRPRPIKLRPLKSGSDSAHLTIPGWVLEAVGLAPGDHVFVTPVASNPRDEAGSVAQIVIVNAVASKRQALTEESTRWSEAGAWKLKIHGKRTNLDGDIGIEGGVEGEDEEEGG